MTKHQKHFRENFTRHCLNCEHYGPHPKTRRVGCPFIAGCPCRILRHLLDGGGCLDPDDPKFRPADQDKGE